MQEWMNEEEILEDTVEIDETEMNKPEMDEQEADAQITKFAKSNNFVFQKMVDGQFVPCPDAAEELAYMQKLQKDYQLHQDDSPESRQIRKDILTVLYTNTERLIVQIIKSHTHDVDNYLGYATLAMADLFLQYDATKSKFTTYLYQYLWQKTVRLKFKGEKSSENDTHYHMRQRALIKKAAKELEEEYNISNALVKDDTTLYLLSERTGLSVSVIAKEIDYLNVRKMSNYRQDEDGETVDIFDLHASEDQISTEEAYEKEEMALNLYELLEILNEEEKMVIKLYFGMDQLRPKHEKASCVTREVMNRCERNFKAITSFLELPQGKAHRILAQALEKLKVKCSSDQKLSGYVAGYGDAKDVLPSVIFEDDAILAIFDGLFKDMDKELMSMIENQEPLLEDADEEEMF